MLRKAALALSEALQGRSSIFATPGSASLGQWYSVKVVVPNMGDSISEGTVATILKQPGDQVKENEAILQVETDKVTIDIKAPVDGTLVGLVVQAEDTVTPGQLVGTIDESSAKANLIGAQPKQQQPASSAAAPAATAAPAGAAPSTSAPEAAHGGRTPGIHFPVRRTPDGQRISALDAAEAQRYQQQQQPSGDRGGGDLSSASGGYGNVDQAATPRGAATAPPAAAASSAGVQPPASGKRGVSVTRLGEMPAKRELTEAEIEKIMLGGA